MEVGGARSAITSKIQEDDKFLFDLIPARHGKMSDRYYCGHCKEKISKTLYYSHKRLFYDITTRQWRSKSEAEASVLTLKDADSSHNRWKEADFTFFDSEGMNV